MTATSAQSASQTTSDLAASRTVLLPGSPATYANRAFLKGLGLRWDPEGHRWHGSTSAENVRALREQLGLEVRVFGSLQAPEDQSRPVSVVLTPGACPVTTPPPTVVLSGSRGLRRVHDGSRTHLEARIAFLSSAEDEDKIASSSRRFTLQEITSGLPDDSREAYERAIERRLRDLRGRVKAARTVVSQTPGLSEALRADRTKAALFCARFGITEAMFHAGVNDEAAEASACSLTCSVGAEELESYSTSE